QTANLPNRPSISHPYQRPFGLVGNPLTPSPVFSNLTNPNGQLALFGGMPHGILPGFNAGTTSFLGQPTTQALVNDRPFKCDQCSHSFNRNHDLKRHKRIHIAIKPFPCTHCDKSFSRKDALKRHMLLKGCGK
ncbi:hypothetical protein K469DRAFT_469865, partial [Zopfia rhizophila CBS 207.26]